VIHLIRYAIPILALTALAAPAAAAEIQIQSPGPVVELTVNEVVNSKPDLAQVGAGVTVRARTAQEAVRQNAAAMEKVVARLRALGIEAKDIQTSTFSLNAQYNYGPDGGTPTFVGYEAANQVSVKLRKLDRVGEVLDALVAAGANNIYGPNFMLDDDGRAKGEARSKAFARGQTMAQDYARMAGYSGIRLLEVSETFQGGGPVPMPVAFRAEAAQDASTPIEPGEVGTGVTVTVKYEMTR
jgi:uncharacterized protein YggE